VRAFSSRSAVLAILMAGVFGCDAGLKSGPTPGQTFQPLQLSVTPASRDFIVPVGGPNPAPQTVSIQNAGPGTVTGLGIGTILYEPTVGGWLTASVGGADFAPATLTLSVNVAGMLPGLYFAIVPVVSSVSGVLERDVVISLQITSAPIIHISPDTVSISGTVGGADPAPQPAVISNLGTGNISGMSVGTIIYDAAATGWINGTLDQPTDPATLTIQATTAGLAAGTYSAIVPVGSNVAGIVPDSVTVVLTMTTTQALPVLGLAPTNVAMVADLGGSNPPNQVVTVTNSGGGTITGLTRGTIQYLPAGNWLGATLNSTTAPTTVDLSANIVGLAAGNYRARFPVSAAGGVSGSPKTVTIDLTVNAAPVLVVTPLTVNFSGTLGQPAPAPQQIAITNGGAGSLTGISAGAITYGAGQTGGWLHATVGSSISPTSLVLTVDPTVLASGTYNATLPVSSTTPGIAPQTVIVTFSLASQTGFFNIITGDGQTDFVDSTLLEPLVARVTDASFNPVAGANVVWQVNNSGHLSSTTTVTSAIGEVTTNWKLGPLAGTQTVRVSSAGLPTLTFTADAQLVPSGNAHPNEPPGFVRFAEHNMSSLPSYPRSLGGLLGSWFGYPQNDPDLVLVTPDTSAPESPPNVIQTIFKAGLPSGNAPVNMGGWDASGTGAAGQKSKMYVSLWVKIVGVDYENQLAGTKLGFIGVGESPSGASNEGYWFMGGTGAQAIQSSFQMSFIQQNQVSRRMNQNRTSARVMTVGSWHHWECLFEINNVGSPDGIFRMWVDGTLIMDYSDVEYITPGNTNRFFSWKWNPTWGGIGGTRTRSDQINIDHVYLSGVP